MNLPGRIVGRRSIGHPADAGSEYEPGCGHQQHSGDTRLPCAGAGVGVFFTHTNGFGGARSDTDNAVPGFSGLGPGVRYFITAHVAVFGEYTYNRATFNFDTLAASGELKRDYSVSHIVGGLSFAL